MTVGQNVRTNPIYIRANESQSSTGHSTQDGCIPMFGIAYKTTVVILHCKDNKRGTKLIALNVVRYCFVTSLKFCAA